MSEKQGKVLFLFDPDNVSPEQMRHALESVLGKEAMQRSGVHLSENQKRVALDWLIHYSGKPDGLVREAFGMSEISLSEIFLPENDLHLLIASKLGHLQ